MTGLRLSSDHERNALKSAVRSALSLIGPAKQLVAVSRISEGYLSKCMNRDLPDFLSVDVALEADRLAGAPVITAAMADLLGYRLVPIKGEAGQAFDADKGLDIVSDAVATAQSMREAAADGRLDERERRDLSDRINGQIKALQDTLRAVNGGGV
jgi:hypothetical protein